MSRFSAETCRLTLARDTWHLAGTGTAVTAPAGDDPAGALLTLGDHSTVRGGRLAVEIADDWLRYLVIEWPPGLRGGAERAAWVAERFRAVHGLGAAEWVLAVDQSAHGAAALASAAPRALVEGVTRFARDRRMRVVALQGSFVAGYKRLRTRPAFSSDEVCGAFGLFREQRLTLGLWAGGQWRRVRSAVVSEGDAAPALGRMLAGWGAEIGAELASSGGASLVRLQGFAPQALAEGLPSGWHAQACAGVA